MRRASPTSTARDFPPTRLDVLPSERCFNSDEPPLGVSPPMTMTNHADRIGNRCTGERRILLLGRNGQTGRELRRSLATLGDVVALARDDVDVTDGGALRRTVREHRP